MAYTTAAEVAAHLGRTFTAAQTTEAGTLLDAADAWINARTGRSWPQSSQITNELHGIDGPLLYLRHAPVASVASLQVRHSSIGSAWSTLTSGADYELIDTASGLIHLSASYVGYLARVTYTPAVALDARITLAAKKLVAFWMRPVLDGVSGDVQSYSVGQELQVTFKKGERTLGVPDDVVELVDSIAPRLVFA